ncbi:hypothetical protein CA13_12060 [Planctomycetes bacterium CA13]|uniref:PEP-CTERM protein-sorting domain-containing protein n=1 Tax=Novipirellula herctigrandis TaxID=2527986 RepID=A0A5C5YXK4_9BACT|nr:hypothetical protein CA13_12060 [Planctomycetes bacterium CA13]
MKRRLCLSLVAAVATFAMAGSVTQAAEVVAFWGFANDYDFDPTPPALAPTKMDFAADFDNTASGNANMQAFIGDGANFDLNGGGGKIGYTSPTSGVVYSPTRTLKWDDLKGGGSDFDIGGISLFDVDRKDGNPVTVGDDFGNDALMYITVDGTGFEDLEFRFDIEATPTSLPPSFDVFYRTGGSGTWFRELSQNNIPLVFQDYDPVDLDNQFGQSGEIELSSSLDNQAMIELIIADFASGAGNSEMEIDNFELVGTPIAVPEPSFVALLLGATGCGLVSRRRRKK